MRRLNLFRAVAVLVLAIAPVAALSSAARADAVTDWNVLMQSTVTTAPTNPLYQARWSAIVQLAVFEAVNAITGDYEPYLGDIAAPSSASTEAAAIVAAHETLVALRPDSAATLDPLRAADLADIPNGPEKDAGIAVGEAAATAMLLLRLDDGWDNMAPYTPGTEPGDFQPLSGQTVFFPNWGQVTPFGIEEGSQYLLPAPPELHTGNYANDYNEVKLLGSADSPFRPDDRTDVAFFYAATSPVALFNSAARQVSAAQGMTLTENARIFALLAMAMADATIAGWDTKYEYNFWRPQAAIRNGDLDGNALTDKDADWLPLIATPAHPSYASGHATVSGAARAVLERVFGKSGHAIVLTNSSLPDIVLAYTAWDEITDDVDDARIYGGIHFRFDQEAGAHQGRQVGRYILRNYLRSPEELVDGDEE
jgi:hypothetical protein